MINDLEAEAVGADGIRSYDRVEWAPDVGFC
jgi:hypothetical protein